MRQIEARAADRPGGIILKASDEPAIADAVNRVTRPGVPVVTLVTDLPRSQRLAYVGMDNRAAGRTAAFLLGRTLGRSKRRHHRTYRQPQLPGRGGARDRLPRPAARTFPEALCGRGDGTYGLDRETRRRVAACLKERRDIVGVYSMGGGNRGILEAFDDARRPVLAYIGHDLDAENRALLEAGRIDAIIDHDVVADARDALRAILHHHRGSKPTMPPSPAGPW